MGRVILLLLLLFSAPTIIWFAWRWLREFRASREVPADGMRWQDAPWTWTIAIGLVLAIASLVAFGVFDPGDCKPVPTHIVNGELVPGHCD